MNCKTLLWAVLFGVFVFGGADSGALQKKEEAPKKTKESEEVAKLAKARLEAAQQAFESRFRPDEREHFSLERYQMSILWLNAQLDVAQKKEQRIAAYAAHLQRLEEWQTHFRKESSSPITMAGLLSLRREAEYWLAREKSTK